MQNPLNSILKTTTRFLNNPHHCKFIDNWLEKSLGASKPNILDKSAKVTYLGVGLV